MDFNAFIELVYSMRTAQKDYFKSRRQSALERSKALERQVDEAIKELVSGGNLFEGGTD